MNRISVFLAVLVSIVVLTGMAGFSFAQSIDALVEARKPLMTQYQAATRDVQLMLADQKIAMEQLRVSLTRKDLGKPQTPDLSAAFYDKIRGLAQKQEKQIAPLQKKRRDLGLKLRENELAQKKIKLDARRKELTSPTAGQGAAK